jgi:exosome complex RNA-binding protein Rrp42 (RNase PH superfamily)
MCCVLRRCGVGRRQTDCANLATLCALLHWRRPDVTVVGDTVTIHSIQDKQPVPLAMHHIPVCLSFAFFNGPPNTTHTHVHATLPFPFLFPPLLLLPVCSGR